MVSFGGFLNEINPRGNGFIGGVFKDDTFKQLVTNPFRNGVDFITNFAGGLQKGVVNVTNGLADILSGNTLYIIIGVVGVGVLIYGYKSLK